MKRTAEESRLLAVRNEVARLQTEKLRLQREIKGFLPHPFIESYYGLVAAVFGDGLGQTSQLANLSDAPKQQLRDSYVTSDGGLKDQRAVEYRKLVDRRLRAMARDIRDWTNGSRAMVKPRKCTGCGLFIDEGWRYCAYCGDACDSQTHTEGSQRKRNA